MGAYIKHVKLINLGDVETVAANRVAMTEMQAALFRQFIETITPWDGKQVSKRLFDFLKSALPLGPGMRAYESDAYGTLSFVICGPGNTTLLNVYFPCGRGDRLDVAALVQNNSWFFTAEKQCQAYLENIAPVLPELVKKWNQALGTMKEVDTLLEDSPIEFYPGFKLES